MERMVWSPLRENDSLHGRHPIALVPADRRGHARTERAEQQREERPVHGVRDGLAGAVGRLRRMRIGIVHAPLRVRLARAGLGGYDLGEIGSVGLRHAARAEIVRDNQSDLGAC